jgi:hypothetical protein
MKITTLANLVGGYSLKAVGGQEGTTLYINTSQVRPWG